MKEKKILEQLSEKIKLTDEKIKIHIQQLDKKLSNINSFNSYLNPNKSQLIKINPIKNIFNHEKSSSLVINLQNKNQFLSKNFNFDLIKIKAIDLKSETQNFLKQQNNCNSNSSKKFYSLPLKLNKFDYILSETFTISSKISILERIILKTIKEIDSLTEINNCNTNGYKKQKNLMSNILINQLENLEIFDLKFNKKYEEILASRVKCENINFDKTENSTKLKLINFDSDLKSSFSYNHYISQRNIFKLCEIQEIDFNMTNLLNNMKNNKSNKSKKFSSKIQFAREKLKDQMKLDFLDYIDIYISSNVINNISNTGEIESIYKMNFVFDETSTKIFIQNPLNFEISFTRENLIQNNSKNKNQNLFLERKNRIEKSFSQRLGLISSKWIKYNIISDIKEVEKEKILSRLNDHKSHYINFDSPLDKNENILGIKLKYDIQSANKISFNTLTENKSKKKLINLKDEIQLKTISSKFSFILINPLKFSKNYFFKNILNKLTEDLEKEKIKCQVIYHNDSEKLFQNIDIILDNFSACILLKSENFEDEFENFHFENLFETINKNFFLFERIFIIIVSQTTEQNFNLKSKCFKCLENFVNMKFNRIKTFSNFAKIELIEINKINEIVDFVSKTINQKENQLSFDNQFELVISELKTTKFFSCANRIRQDFKFINFYQIIFIISLYIHDSQLKVRNKQDTPCSNKFSLIFEEHLGNLENKFLTKNIQFDKMELIEVISFTYS